jgi:hypothetical protein
MTHEQILAAVPDVVIEAWDGGWRLWFPTPFGITTYWRCGAWIPSTLEHEQ